ncbi:SDR family NAD(P)-dependent oxidoreductase [Streptomyces nitrosporeus]|uniref:SDR family NAD(P)-dependent oxidoreductase n=1 Tax=Streptomyces nitrosporeus TaxID=28894 RepID=A0A5J6FE43_9ACTN|nr:NAD(P)H-binding protein [Streptomyces nitrosporeus]QEU73160.1 SDR family NAD(P)-dependent oxidoreductase [Streptomyces nitrosporeus]GGZ10075.1 nucleotide-diphosphate-sugar epimerase [Streptomyces nitrosporeus]
MILVTGASGTVGAEVARQLAPRCAVRLMARDPGRITAGGPRTEAVAADYENPVSLGRALRGVRTAFLVTGHPARRHDEAFLAAAAAAGVRHVVKLSAAVVGDDTDDLVTRRQRETEEAVRRSPLTWALLRPRAFMSNTLAWAPGIRAGDTVAALYGDAPNTPVDPRDVASVAVRLLMEPERHAGRTCTLVGPEALTAVQQTRILSELLGRPLRFRPLTRREAAAELMRRYPPEVAEALLRRADLQAAGGKKRTGTVPPELTGGPLRTYRAWALGHLHHFGGRSPALAPAR